MTLRPLLLLALAAIAPAAASRELPKLDAYLIANVTIDPAGHITALAWQGEATKLEKFLIGRVEPVVRAWEFVPGKLDGVPAETRTRIWIRVGGEATPDGSLALHFIDAHTGPLGSTLPPPHFPKSESNGTREAVVTVTVAVGADGSATLVESEVDSTATRKGEARFVAAAEGAVAQWRFEPETVGGKPVGTTLRVPVAFCFRDISDWCDRRRATKDAAPDNQPIALDPTVTLKTDIATQKI
jgi:TonB family protein